MENSKVLCVFHSPCLDGFASAWIVGHRFGFDNVEFVGVKYGDPVPDMTDREVYIVDFSYPPVVLIPAAKTAKSIVVLDHHETAKQQWKPASTRDGVVLYDLGDWRDALGYPSEFPLHEPMPSNLRVEFRDDVAGVGTTWDNFFDETTLPLLLNAIDNGDRWVFDKFERVRDVCEYCRAHGFTRASSANFTKFTKLVESTDSEDPWGNYHDIADRGAEIATVYDNLLLEFVPFDNPRLIEFAGYVVPCHAVPDFFKSSVGDRFGKKYPFSITYDDNLVPGHRKFSLRSDKNGGVDVEVIAKRLGGGGHEHAAGFLIPFKYPHHDASVETMLEQATVTPISKKSD